MTTPAVSDLIRKSFLTSLKRDADDVRMIFHKDTATWESLKKRKQEMDRERLAEGKVQGKGSAQRGIAEGYSKEISARTISITRIVSGEAFKTLTAHGLAKMAISTGEDVIDKIELDMKNFLGYGESTSYVDNGGFVIDTTVGDTLPLFHTGHTLKNSPTTYSNILSGAPSLTEDAIPGALDYFNYNVMDNYGKRTKMKPNVIVTTSKAIMKKRVERLFGSISPEKIEGNANANSGVKNTNKNLLRHLIVDFDVNALDEVDASKSFYWMVGAVGGNEETSFQGYYISWMSPMTAPVEIDQNKWTLSYTARAVCGIGAVSGKGLLLVKATS